MAIKFIRNDENGLLSQEDFDLITRGLGRGARRASNHMRIPDVDILVVAERDLTHRGIPITGRCYGPHLTRIKFDVDDTFYQNPNSDFSHKVISHELHHNTRREGLGYGDITLGDLMVTEGLAQKFELEVTGSMPLTASALTQREIALWEHYVKENAHDFAFDQRSIFMGSNDPTGVFPEWFGYSFGYALVDAGLQYLGQTSAQAVCLDSSAIIRPWLDGEFSISENPVAPANAAYYRVKRDPFPKSL